MKNYLKIIILAAIQFTGYDLYSQKITDHINQSWISINSNFYLNKHWFIVGDVHLRENKFFASGSFIMGRTGIGYQLNKNVTVVAGYANLLSTPSGAGLTTKSDENRIYEQLQVTSSFKKLKLLQRIRNEQRWQQIVVNNTKTGKNKFTNRIRYLVSASLQVFKNPNLPQLALADECAIQFGKTIVYNTFDQNRIFIGIKQKITHDLSFDTGYMTVYQQKSNGINYTQANTFRLFFYYTLPPKKAVHG